jgi:hypothetical protein
MLGGAQMEAEVVERRTRKRTPWPLVEALRKEETLTPAGRYNPGHEHGRSYGGYARGW